MPRALIVGAGLGGLAAGVALQRAGWEVRIYEKSASPRELGFGLLLAPNALAALRELHVADAVTSTTVPQGTVEVRRLNGELLRRFNAQIGGPAVVALRRSEEHTSELQSLRHLVCRLLLEKKKTSTTTRHLQ